MKAPFKFKFLQGLRNLDENYMDENDSFISPAEVGKELTDRVLTAEPLNGIVGPYQQIPINFVCRTKKHDKKGGFSDQVDEPTTGVGTKMPGTAESGGNRSISGGSLAQNFANVSKSRFSVKP